MRRSLPDITQELLQILLILKYVLVKVGHLGNAHNLAALLQKDRDTNVLGKRHQGVQVAQDLLVGPLLVKLFEVLPVTLEWSRLHIVQLSLGVLK